MTFEELLTAGLRLADVKERVIEAAVRGTPERLWPQQVDRLVEEWISLLREFDLVQSARRYGTASYAHARRTPYQRYPV